MSAFERRLLWVATLVVAVSGIVYFVMKYWLTPPEAFAVINHPLQPVFLKLHLVASPLLVFAVGLVTTRHIWRHYRSGTPTARRTGLTGALSVGPMVVSGYLVQVMTHEGWVRAVAWAHIVTGVLFTAGFVAHQAVLRRARPRG